MIPSLVPKNLSRVPRNYLLSFFGKAYLVPLVIVETLGIFVVIARWFFCVLADLRV